MAGILTISLCYLWIGVWLRYRETIYRRRCPRGAWAAASTVLFWPIKIGRVFWKKWRRG